jgi:hypothetical protein
MIVRGPGNQAQDERESTAGHISRGRRARPSSFNSIDGFAKKTSFTEIAQ